LGPIYAVVATIGLIDGEDVLGLIPINSADILSISPSRRSASLLA
jgi:hypothetical protein